MLGFQKLLMSEVTTQIHLLMASFKDLSFLFALSDIVSDRKVVALMVLLRKSTERMSSWVKRRHRACVQTCEI